MYSPQRLALRAPWATAGAVIAREERSIRVVVVAGAAEAFGIGDEAWDVALGADRGEGAGHADGQRTALAKHIVGAERNDLAVGQFGDKRAGHSHAFDIIPSGRHGILPKAKVPRV